MAEVKKDDKDKKEEDAKKAKAKAAIDRDWTIFIIILFLAMGGVATKIGGVNLSKYLDPLYLLTLIPESIKIMFRKLTIGYLFFANIVCLFLLTALIYALIKHRDVEKNWRKELYPIPQVPDENKPKNDKWERVRIHIASVNPSDWRLSILEADIILDELLEQLGYTGDTIGEKLKKVARGDFQTLDAAWEAHKIRNAIAHEGQDFVLSQRDAERVITLYQSVFQEFDYI